MENFDDFVLEEPPEFYRSDKDFTSLAAWQDTREVKLFFYNNVLPKLPNSEKYNLDIQIRKAAVSGTANIAEGYGRFHYQEAIQFYRVSRASVYELKDHLISSLDLEYIIKEIYDNGSALIEKAKVSIN
ncbi:MAG: four helix bundle protein [Bacteroidales bacterium]|nr:four helix bundle protein [Bacteroidales bacterium]MCF8344768.1 four helix bundle protein [Bacteroidales bacterium]